MTIRLLSLKSNLLLMVGTSFLMLCEPKKFPPETTPFLVALVGR